MIIIPHTIAIILGLFIAYDLTFLIDSQYSFLIFWVGFFSVYCFLNSKLRSVFLIGIGIYIVISFFIIEPIHPPIGIQTFFGADRELLLFQHNLYKFKILILFLPITIGMTYYLNKSGLSLRALRNNPFYTNG